MELLRECCRLFEGNNPFHNYTTRRLYRMSEKAANSTWPSSLDMAALWASKQQGNNKAWHGALAIALSSSALYVHAVDETRKQSMHHATPPAQYLLCLLLYILFWYTNVAGM